MRFFGKGGGLAGATTAKFVLLAAATIGTAGALPGKADAQYTVYIYNTRTTSGWIRSGFEHDVYKSYQACRSSIVSRVNENRRFRTDFEAFAIVRHNSRPPAGRLVSYASATVIYIPGRGYVASAGDRTTRGDTAVCLAEPTGATATFGHAASTLTPFLRREPVVARRDEAVA